MVNTGKIQRPIVSINPQELAQRIATEGGLKGILDKAIESSSNEYRSTYKKLLESKRNPFKKGVKRFQATEADTISFLEEVYQNIPSFFKKMIDDAVEEQAEMNGLSQKHKDELRRELANVIDQELRLKGKFA